MATVKINVTNEWTQVALSSENFLLENVSSFDVSLTYADETPSESHDAYHTLKAREAMIRLADGNVYIKSENISRSPVVVVSTGG